MTNTGCLASRETVVVDTSALIAVLSMEPESARLAAAMEADANRLVSAATVVEAGLVIEARYGSAGGRELSYALARVTGEPLLFKGDDFTHTDITPVDY